MSAYIDSMTNTGDYQRVYVSYESRNGRHCQFLEADLKTSLSRSFHFALLGKFIELVQRDGGGADQEGGLTLNEDIEKGKGGVFLSLTGEQYSKPER